MNSNALIAGIVAVLVIGGGLIFAATNSDDDTTETTTQSQTQQADETTQSNDSDTMTEEKSSKTIVDLAVETESLSTLVTAVTEADLVETLSSEGPFTVFAPTNDAFAALPDGTLDTLLMPENKEDLQSVLTYHVVPAKALSTDLSDGQVLTTVQGATLTVKIADGKVMLMDGAGSTAEVISADIAASNGVVHVIDSVVLPE